MHLNQSKMTAEIEILGHTPKNNETLLTEKSIGEFTVVVLLFLMHFIKVNIISKAVS